MKRNASGWVALTVLCITLGTGDAVMATAPSRSAAAVERANREARILAWILERNPAAGIEEFVAFPAVLLDESARAGIDYRLILAMADKESGLNPRAVGRRGEVGLLQLLPSTATLVAKRLGVLGSLGDPKVNVRYGIEYLKWQVERFGMTPDALRAYNRHPDRAREVWSQDRYAEDVALRYLTLVHRLE